jgi:hypothetical protein
VCACESDRDHTAFPITVKSESKKVKERGGRDPGRKLCSSRDKVALHNTLCGRREELPQTPLGTERGEEEKGGAVQRYISPQAVRETNQTLGS